MASWKTNSVFIKAVVSMDRNLKGTILIMLSACAFGLMPTLSKLSMKEGLNVSSILAYRFTLASIFIWVYILVKGKSYKTTKSHLIYLISISVIGYVGTSATYFSALKYVSSYIAAILMYIYPSLIVAYEILYLKEKVDYYKEIVALVVATVGIILIVWNDEINASFLGILLSLASGFFYAFYTVGLQEKRTKEMESIVVTGYILLFSAISFLGKSVVTNTLILPNFKAWIYIITFALVSSCFAIFAYAVGVKLIGDSRTEIISTLEPVFATFMGVIIFNEKLTLFSIIGGIMIISAIIILQVKGDEKVNNLESKEQP